MSGLVQFGNAVLLADVDFEVRSTSITGLPNGGYAVSWYRAPYQDLPQILTQMVGANGVLVDQNGAAAGTAFTMPFAGTQTVFGQGVDKIVALANGGYVVVYGDGTYNRGSSSHDVQVTYQVFDATGAATTTGFVPGGGGNNVWTSHHDVTATADGGFAISHHQLGAGTWLFEDGVGNLNAISANGATTSVDTLGDGYVVTWQDTGTNGTQEVFGALIDAAGVVGPAFQVNSIIGGDQRLDLDTHSVEELSNGNFVVVWQDASGSADDASGSAVRARIFGQTGVPVTGDILVNTTTAGDQTAPEILALGDGGFAVAWRDGASVLLQIFDAAGEQRGEETSIIVGGADTTYGIGQLENGQLVLSYYATADGAIYTQTFLVTKDGTELGDVMNGTEGPDALDGREGSDTINGAGGGDTLLGGDDNDTLNGGGGGDNMIGGSGSDAYYIDSSADIVDESVAGSDGSDTVRSSNISINLIYASKFRGAIENAALDGSAGLNLTGNGLDNRLTGNTGINIIEAGAGNDTLDGKGGGDTMRGFTGNDTYYIDNAGDIADESIAGSNGSDTARSSTISINLGLSNNFRGTIESAVLEGTASLNLTGNGLSNYLQGNSGANILNGGAAADTLVGLGGNDIFRFANSLGSTNIDRITDFNVAQDRIELENAYFTALPNGWLYQSAFVANTTGLAQDASDRIIYEIDTGKLFYDSNGTASGGTYQHFATISVGLIMSAGEFFVT